MVARPLVVVNARASSLRRKPERIAAVSEAVRGRADVVVTRTIDDLDDALAKRADDVPETVALVGGDGTHMAGVTALVRVLGAERLPKIALVAGGTVNTTARAWGSTGKTLRDLERVLAGAPTVTRATLDVRDDRGARNVAFIFGTGLVARFFDLYDAEGGGVGTAARLTAWLVAGAAVGAPLARRVLAPMPCTVSVDGAPPKADRHSLVVASVHRDVGLGIRVTYRAGEAPDRVHVVASTASTFELARLYPRTLLGLPFGREKDVDALAKEVVIRFLEPPGPYVLDGDTLRATEVRIGAGPRIQVLDLRNP